MKNGWTVSRKRRSSGAVAGSGLRASSEVDVRDETHIRRSPIDATIARIISFRAFFRPTGEVKFDFPLMSHPAAAYVKRIQSHASSNPK